MKDYESLIQRGMMSVMWFEEFPRWLILTFNDTVVIPLNVVVQLLRYALRLRGVTVITYALEHCRMHAEKYIAASKWTLLVSGVA